MTEPLRIKVLGVGNTLAGDDGVGPRVIEQLESAYDFPPGVELIDAGTPGLNLTDQLLDADVVVLVDAVAGPAPAQMRVLRGEEALACLPLERSGAHEPLLRRSLAGLRLAGRGPRELLLVAITPRQWRLGAGLSPPVRRAVGRAASAVLRELARLGVAHSRASRRDPAPRGALPRAGRARRP